MYLFQIADYPEHCLGEPDCDPQGLDWYSGAIASKRDGLIEPWMREYFPTKIFVDPEDNKLLDVVGNYTGYCFNRKTKDLIESLEPNVHQFLEVVVHYGDQREPYYLLRFGITEDCYDLEQSNFEWDEINIGQKKVRYWVKLPLKPMALVKSKIAGKHLWQNRTGQNQKFMSSELHDLFETNRVTGLKYEKQLIVDVS